MFCCSAEHLVWFSLLFKPFLIINLSRNLSQLSAINQSEGWLKNCAIFIGWEGQIGDKGKTLYSIFLFYWTFSPVRQEYRVKIYRSSRIFFISLGELFTKVSVWFSALLWFLPQILSLSEFSLFFWLAVVGEEVEAGLLTKLLNLIKPKPCG